MTHLNKQQFQAWAYDDLLANTTRGLLAEYIVATAVGTHHTKRVEWDQYDLKVDGIGVEVKSAAYVQSWKQTRPSVISFDISPKTGWAAATNTYAASPRRSADVYVFCLLKGKKRKHIDPLDVGQWSFFVLATSVLNREVPVQKRIQLGPLKALGPRKCTYDQLKSAIHAAAAVNRRAKFQAWFRILASISSASSVPTVGLRMPTSMITTTLSTTRACVEYGTSPPDTGENDM